MADLYRIAGDETSIGYSVINEWEGTLIELLLDRKVLVPVEPCGCDDDEYQDPRAWGDYPPLGSADLKGTS